MSKINISFDTVTKSCDANINGIKVENLSEVTIFRSGDNKYMIDLITRVGDFSNDDGTVTVVKIMASDIEKTKAKYPDLSDCIESIDDDRDNRIKVAACKMMNMENVVSSYYKN